MKDDVVARVVPHVRFPAGFARGSEVIVSGRKSRHVKMMEG